MAHTCSMCGMHTKKELAPGLDGESFVTPRHSKNWRGNGHYRHDHKSWKVSSKAGHQWGRHLG